MYLKCGHSLSDNCVDATKYATMPQLANGRIGALGGLRLRVQLNPKPSLMYTKAPLTESHENTWQLPLSGML